VPEYVRFTDTGTATNIHSANIGAANYAITGVDPSVTQVLVTIYEREEFEERLQWKEKRIARLQGVIEHLEAQIKILSGGGLSSAQSDLLREVVASLEYGGQLKRAEYIREAFGL